MFDIAWTEFLVVAVVALVVVGPRDLPGLLRTVGKTIASLRRMAGEFQGQFNEAMREAELDDLKREVTGLKDSASKMVGASPFQIARDELKSALSDKPKKTPSALAGETPSLAQPDDTPSAFAPPVPQLASAEQTPRPVQAEPAPPPDDKPAAKRRSPAARATVGKASVDKTPTPRPAPRKTAAKAPNGVSKPAAKTAAKTSAKPSAKPAAKASVEQPTADAADAPSPPGAAA